MGSTTSQEHLFCWQPGFSQLETTVKFQLRALEDDINSRKRCFKFDRSYFVTELCNILLCYIKIPVRELNFVPLTTIQRTY